MRLSARLQLPRLLARTNAPRAAAIHSTVKASSKMITPWADPAMRQYKFWNREESTEQGRYQDLLEISPDSVVQQANIITLSDIDDPADKALQKGPLPWGSSLLGGGTTLEELEHLRTRNPNVLFVSPSCPRASQVLPQVLAAFPSIQWVHCRSAGIDFVTTQELGNVCLEHKVQMTNAKGQFSSSLAEYALFACSYFAKDLPRLMNQQRAK
jgi:hypothetical protein